MSVEVVTMTPTAPAVRGPNVNPDKVMVNAVVAGMVAPKVVIINELAVVALQVAVKLNMLAFPAVNVGTTASAKNEAG